MSSTTSETVSAAQYAEMQSVRPRFSVAWSVFTAHVVDLERTFSQTVSFADNLLSLRVSGRCRIRQRAEGRSLIGRSGPGDALVVPAHMTAQWDTDADRDGSRAIVLFVPQTFLARIAEEYGIESRKVEIVPQFMLRDPVVESVLIRLAMDAQDGSPSGQLYAESACEFLGHHMLRTFSSRSKLAAPRVGGLTGRRLRAVIDYVEENLGESITLRTLAGLAGVSPRHFERAFRQAVGSPPHAYVMERRISAARCLLTAAERTLTIEAIAAKVGFSSSSHLAAVFRRRTGCSPAAFRRMQRR